MDHISPERTKIGWIGTGVMGVSMCGHLLSKKYVVTVHSRTRSNAQPLVEAGAAWADSPRAVVEQSDVIFTMLGFPSDVREVYFSELGLLSGTRSGHILVDTTTSEPGLAQDIATAVRVRGAHAVDAPVSGGDIGARNAALSIMVGGDQDVVRALMPLLKVFGSKIIYQGAAGSGQHCKLCNQIVIAGTMIGVCESLLYGFKAGLNLETMLESIRGGAAACWTLDNLAPRILRRNFDPGFLVEHFIKDMGIVLEESKRLGIALPGLSLAHLLYLSVQAHGHGKLGTHALMLALEDLAKVGPQT